MMLILVYQILFFFLQGKPFRSRPYRFKVRNGDYIVLETDWSCFINPWSRRLEFVLGKHTVLKVRELFCFWGIQLKM